MTAPGYYTLDIVLGANARVPLALHGEFFHVQEATGAFNIYVDGQYKARVEKGLGYQAPKGAGFLSLDLEDLTGAGNTIRLAYGFGDFRDQRTTISGSVSIAGTVATAETKAAGIDDAADVTLNNGAETSLGAAPANTRTRLLVSDPANTVNVRIGKTGQVGAARGALLQPGQSMAVDTGATVYAYAAAAGQKISQTFVVD